MRRRRRRRRRSLSLIAPHAVRSRRGPRSHRDWCPSSAYVLLGGLELSGAASIQGPPRISALSQCVEPLTGTTFSPPAPHPARAAILSAVVRNSASSGAPSAEASALAVVIRGSTRQLLAGHDGRWLDTNQP